MLKSSPGGADLGEGGRETKAIGSWTETGDRTTVETGNGIGFTKRSKMNTQQIEDEIVSALKAIPKQFPNGGRNSEWTKAILLAIGTLGQKLGYAVCGLREHFQSAWLFDLSWYSASSPDGKLLDVPLVLESEWDKSYKFIRFDFEKLLIAKSKFKVMIFQASGQTIIDYFKELEQGIRTYQGGSLGEIYLLACFNEEKWEFEIKRIEGV